MAELKLILMVNVRDVHALAVSLAIVMFASLHLVSKHKKKLQVGWKVKLSPHLVSQANRSNTHEPLNTAHTMISEQNFLTRMSRARDYNKYDYTLSSHSFSCLSFAFYSLQFSDLHTRKLDWNDFAACIVKSKKLLCNT